MGKARILIVDDEQAVREALKRWFLAHGFEADVASDGAESIEKVAHDPFDVVIMDLEMPKMGGKDAICEIRAIAPDLPIVVLTGYSDRADDTAELGALKVLTKPLRLGDLEEEVRKILGCDTAAS